MFLDRFNTNTKKNQVIIIEYFKEFLKRTGVGLKELLKAKAISSLINLIVLIIGLKIANVNYYPFIAILIALIDLLPVLGQGLILIPRAIISLITGSTSLAIILIILFIITFILDQILEPIILGKSIGLKPLYTLAITMMSMIIFTPALGALIGSVLSIVLSVMMDMRKSMGNSKQNTNIK